MLEKSSLLNYARQRDMPTTKIRGIIREYLHVLMLRQIYYSKYSGDYFFTGGTSLRLIDNIKRFSEDLDFYSLISTEDEFEALVDDIMKGTRQYGIEGQYTVYKRGTLLTADINFRDIEKYYGIEMRKKSGLMIKVESAVPGWDIKGSREAVIGYGETFALNCLDQSILLADKIDALHKKPRARHIYDIIHLLSKKIEPDRTVLNYYDYHSDWKEVLRKRMSEFTDNELNDYADRFAPFLFNEDDKHIIKDAKIIIKKLIENFNEDGL